MSSKDYPNLTKYIQKILIELIDAHFAIDLFPKSADYDWFSEKDRTVSSSGYGFDWLTWAIDLVHEYNHYIQWCKNQVYGSRKYTNQYIKHDNWLNHKIEISDYQLKKCVSNIQACELDCEQKTVKDIRKYNLEVDETDLVKQANAYIYSYSIITCTREQPIQSPCDCKSIIDTMPSKLLSNYLYPPYSYIRAAEKYCYKRSIDTSILDRWQSK